MVKKLHTITLLGTRNRIQRDAANLVRDTIHKYKKKYRSCYIGHEIEYSNYLKCEITFYLCDALSSWERRRRELKQQQNKQQ